MASVFLFNPFAVHFHSVLSEKLKEFVPPTKTIATQVASLQDTIEVIVNVLLDTEGKPVDPDVEEFLQRLSMAIYNADDLLDEIFTGPTRRLPSGEDGRGGDAVVCCTSPAIRFVVASFLGKIRTDTRKMARDFVTINESLIDLSEEMRRFMLVSAFHDLARKAREETGSRYTSTGYIPIVGRDKELQTLLGFLLDYETGRNDSVIAIVGMGGLGKTTLAKLLFQHESIDHQFDLKVWVNVGEENFDLKRIVGKIVESATQQRNNYMLEPSELMPVLRRSIRGRRLLLVLDDVCKVDPVQWKSLLDLLQLEETGSKLLITSRFEIAAAKASLHHLQGLDEEDSMSLASTVLYNGEEPRNLAAREKTLEESILRYGGNPLLIRTLGMQFADPRVWANIAYRHFEGGQVTDKAIDSAVELTYQQLPLHLKLCFSYCSLFPIDLEIEVQTLIHLWIAQGVVKHPMTQQEIIEDVGHSYFVELMRRSLVQGEEDDFGNVKTFRVNNVMHRLSRLIAGSALITVKNGDCKIDRPFICDEARHVSFYTHLDVSVELPSTVISARSLRTIFLASQELRPSCKLIHPRSILKAFSYVRLRALDAHNSGIKQVPASIRNLKNLRYLDLSENDDIELLPESISELSNLDVLNLSGCELLKRLPSSIGKLVNLRHLYCKGCWNLSHMPRSIGELTSLITLTWFVLPKNAYAAPRHAVADLSVLGSLNLLRGRLEIRNLGAYIKIFGVSELSESSKFLRKKKGLQSLSLCWDPNLDEEGSAGNSKHHDLFLKCLEPPLEITELELCEYGGEEFPSWLSSLKNLTSLQIRDCRRCRSLPTLEDFPLLKFCRFESLPELEFIVSNSAKGEGKNSSSSYLPGLKKLYIFKCPKLRGWWKEVDGLLHQFQDCLSRLEIRNCPKLDQMPLFPSLKERLFLENTSLAPLRQTMQIQAARTGASSSSNPVTGPLSQLKALWISSIKENQDQTESWVQELASLQELRIDCWKSLTFLPQKMRGMTSLRKLDIRRCPQLKQRCAGKKAVDWPYISHVPNITIDEKTIQSGGIYQLKDEESAALISNFHLVHPLSFISSVTIENLDSVPEEWLRNLTTLKKLKAVNCPGLEWRPLVVNHLPSIPKLQIKQRVTSLQADLSTGTSSVPTP